MSSISPNVMNFLPNIPILQEEKVFFGPLMIDPAFEEVRACYAHLASKSNKNSIYELLTLQDRVANSTCSVRNTYEYNKMVEDIEALVIGLTESFGTNCNIAKSKALFDPHHSFTHEGQRYVIKFTRGKGSCALHALLGQEISGVYRFHGAQCDVEAKKHFTTALKNALLRKDEEVIKHFISIMMEYLNDAFREGGTFEAKLLFSTTPAGCDFLEQLRKLQAGYLQQIEANKAKKAVGWLSLAESNVHIYNRLMAEVEADQAKQASAYVGKRKEEVWQVLSASPIKILNIIETKVDDFLDLLEQVDRANLEQLEGELIAIRQERGESEQRFILSEAMVKHYIDALTKPEFFLNTHEIKLAAKLFKKNVLIFASAPIELTETIDEGGDDEPIIIHHHGAHFSRCIKNEEEEPRVGLKPLAENPLQATHPSGCVLGIPESHPYHKAYPEWCVNVRSSPKLREEKNYKQKIKECKTKMSLQDTEEGLGNIEKEYLTAIDRAVSEILKSSKPDAEMVIRNIRKICENAYELLVIPMKKVLMYISTPWAIYSQNQLEFRASLSQLLEKKPQEIPQKIFEVLLKSMSDNKIAKRHGELLDQYPEQQILVEALVNKAKDLLKQAKQTAGKEINNYFESPAIHSCFKYIFGSSSDLLSKYTLMLQGAYSSLKEIPGDFSSTIVYSSYIPKIECLLMACQNFKIDQFEEFKEVLKQFENIKNGFDHFQNTIIPLILFQQVVKNSILWPNCYELAEGETSYLLSSLFAFMFIKPVHTYDTPMIPYKYLSISDDDQKRARAILKNPKASGVEKRSACRLLLHASIPWSALQNIGKLLDRGGSLKAIDSAANRNLVASSLYDILPELHTVYKAIEQLIEFELTEFEPKAPLVPIKELPERCYANIQLLGSCSEICRDVKNIQNELLRWNHPLSSNAFSTKKLKYASLRTLQVVGEVAKNLRRGGLLSSDIVWRDLESLRDLLAHPERHAVYKKLQELNSGLQDGIFVKISNDFKKLFDYFEGRTKLFNTVNEWSKRKQIVQSHETFLELTGVDDLCDFLAYLLPGRISKTTKEQLKATVCNGTAQSLRQEFLQIKGAILKGQLKGPPLETAIQKLPLSGAEQKKLKEAAAILTSSEENQTKRMHQDKQSTIQEMIALLKHFKEMKKIAEASVELSNLSTLFESIKDFLKGGLNDGGVLASADKAQGFVDLIIKKMPPGALPEPLEHIAQKLKLLLEPLSGFLHRKQLLCNSILTPALYEEEWEMESHFNQLVRDLQYRPMEVPKLELRLKKLGIAKTDIQTWKEIDARIKKSETAQKQKQKHKEMIPAERKKQAIISINIIRERILALDSLIRSHPEMNNSDQFTEDPLMQLSCEYLISGFRKGASNLELYLNSMELPEIALSDLQDSLRQSINIGNEILHARRITNSSSLTPYGHAYNTYIQMINLLKNFSIGPNLTGIIESLDYKLQELKKRLL